MRLRFGKDIGTCALPLRLVVWVQHIAAKLHLDVLLPSPLLQVWLQPLLLLLLQLHALLLLLRTVEQMPGGVLVVIRRGGICGLARTLNGGLHNTQHFLQVLSIASRTLRKGQVLEGCSLFPTAAGQEYIFPLRFFTPTQSMRE
jgi:hypothetical protein